MINVRLRKCVSAHAYERVSAYTLHLCGQRRGGGRVPPGNLGPDVRPDGKRPWEVRQPQHPHRQSPLNFGCTHLVHVLASAGIELSPPE